MPFGGMLTLAAGGAIIGGVGSAISGAEQAGAAKSAQKQTAQQIQDATTIGQGGATSAENNLNAVIPSLYGNINAGYLGSQDYLTQGLGAQRQDLMDSGALSSGAINGAQSDSLASLYGGAGQGIGYLGTAQGGVDQALNSSLANAQAALGGRSGNAQALLDQSGGLYGNYHESPGYQFALQQGEQGINRAAAAAGGRYSGATLKALGQFDTGLANQDYQNYVANQNSLFQNSLGADQNSLSANSQLASLYGNAGSQSAAAAQGLGSQAAQYAYGAGQGAAGIQQNAGNTLADIYGRTGTQLAGADAGAGTALAQNASNYYGNLNSLGLGTTQQLNNYILGASQLPASMLGAQMQNNQSTVPYAGSTAAALGNLGTSLGTLGALYGSGAFDSGGSYGGSGINNFGSWSAQNGPGLTVPLNQP